MAPISDRYLAGIIADIHLEARAKAIVQECTDLGGLEELRRVARLGLPLNRQIEGDSPKLRNKVQEIADRQTRYEPLWLSGFRPGAIVDLRERVSLDLAPVTDDSSVG